MEKKIEKKIIEQYLNNIESAIICDNFKIGRSTLGRVVKRNNIPKRKVVRPKIKPKYDYAIGQVFNNLKILEIVKKSLYKDNTYYAICECLLCGRKDYKAKPYDIIKGHNKSCGCNKRIYIPKGSECHSYKGVKDLSGQRWSLIRFGAESRNLEFEIKIKETWDLYEKQCRKCSLTGMDIYFGESNTSEFTASLDRIDSSKGYLKDNIQWVHKDVNKMKKDLSEKVFIDICGSISGVEKCVKKMNLYYSRIEKQKIKMFLSNRGQGHSQLHKAGKRNPMFKGHEEISGFFWSAQKNRAKVKGRDFNIDIVDLRNMYLEQNRKCFLSKLDISFGATSKLPTSASIDRIDSSKGYIKGNAQWVHKNVNKMKSDFEQEYFIFLCNKVTEYKYGKYIINKRRI